MSFEILNEDYKSDSVSELIDTCAQITKEKGFDVTMHKTQVLLIGTEIREALQCLSDSKNNFIELSTNIVSDALDAIEERRKARGVYHFDKSEIADIDGLCEELADVCIRVFSYIGGNGLKEKFINSLEQKIEKNRNRPHLHGKAF